MKVHRALLSAFLLLTAAGCNSGHGPDSLFARQPHPSEPISDCVRCHNSANSPALDPLVSNGSGTSGKHVKHVSERKIACERCHNGYINAATHMNGVMNTADPLVNLVAFNITGPAGAWVNDTGPGTGGCSGVACHGSSTLDWYGTNTWTTPATCTDCHSSTFSPVLDPVLTNGAGASGKHVKHVATIGFACSKCHLNYPSRTSHASGVMDTQDPSVLLVYFDGTNTSGAWTGDSGQETGSCASTNCHSGQTPAWYGTAGVTTPACVVCHANAIGTRRAVMGANGDFGANAAVKSHHVSGASDPVTDQCLVCHDLSIHMGGTVRLRNGDTNATIAYDPATVSTLEPFCLSCHDASGATSTFRSGGTPTAPFIDGSTIGTAPYRASAEISANWTKTYGHKQKGLTCVGDGTPNTGCHGNGHGTAYVGMLAKNLTLPNTNYSKYKVSDEPDYDLCFTCHASYSRVTKEAILGMKAGGNYANDLLATWGALPAYTLPSIMTHFRDVDLGPSAKPYDDPVLFNSAHENLHMYHVQSGDTWYGWRYRDTTNSSINCLSCHSVHGSNTQWGWVYDELLFSHTTETNGDQYGRFGTAPANLDLYPMSCTFNCHQMFPPTSSWFEPSQE